MTRDIGILTMNFEHSTATFPLKLGNNFTFQFWTALDACHCKPKATKSLCINDIPVLHCRRTVEHLHALDRLKKAMASPQDHSIDDQLKLAVSSGDVQKASRLINGGVDTNTNIWVS